MRQYAEGIELGHVPDRLSSCFVAIFPNNEFIFVSGLSLRGPLRRGSTGIPPARAQNWR